MTLILNNEDVNSVPSMEVTMKAFDETLRRIDVSLRLGSGPAPWGLPQLNLPDGYVTYAALPGENAGFKMKEPGQRVHGVIAGGRAVLLVDLVSGKKNDRTSGQQITYSERGNIQGLSFSR